MSRKNRERRKARRAALFAGKGKVLRLDQNEPEPEKPTIFSDDTPKAFAADGKLAGMACRSRGLPGDIAKAAYDAGRRLLARTEMDEHGFSKVAGGLAAIAKVDIETAQYRDGEPANTLNVNQNVAVAQQMSLADLLAADRAKIKASYLPPIPSEHETHSDNPDGNGHPDGVQHG